MVSTIIKLGGKTLFIPEIFQKKLDKPNPTSPPRAKTIGKFIVTFLLDRKVIVKTIVTANETMLLQ